MNVVDSGGNTHHTQIMHLHKTLTHQTWLKTLVWLALQVALTTQCNPGRRFSRSTRAKYVIETQQPRNVAETNEQASGPFLGPVKKSDPSLMETINTHIIFKNFRFKADSRFANEICTVALRRLSDAVQAHWAKKYKLYVLEGFISNVANIHSKNSLHLEGRAFDLKLANSDPTLPRVASLSRKELQELAGLAFYKSRFHFVKIYHDHIHVSCRRSTGGPKQKERSRCFPEDAIVRTPSGRQLMKDLRAGDQVLTMTDDRRAMFTEVSAIMHRQDDVSVEDYVEIRAQNSSLVLSEYHLVFANHVAVFAKDVRVDDVIMTYDAALNSFSPSHVTSVKSKTRRGAYAPLTMQGTIVVDDTYASCYALTPYHHLAHRAFWPWRIFYNLARPNKVTANEEIHWYPRLLRTTHTYLNLFQM